jgi:intracellular sulfur oxidation DsrE/DsrF family protein
MFRRTDGAFRGGIMARLAFVLAAVGALALPFASLPAQAEGKETNRVVIQVSDNDPSKWNLALNNARNLQSDLGRDNVDIEIVVYGPGIGMLKAESVVGSRIDEALASGVNIVACENTMAGQKLTRADMLPKIGYVKAGVVELMQKEQQGWAYVRP